MNRSSALGEVLPVEESVNVSLITHAGVSFNGFPDEGRMQIATQCRWRGVQKNVMLVGKDAAYPPRF